MGLLGLSLLAPPCGAALRPYQTFPVGSWASVVAIGDLNGDGRADVAIATRSAGDPVNDQSVFVFLQQANGELAAPVRYSTGLDARGISIGDLNSDGRADLAVCGGNGVAVLRQRLDGTLAPAEFIATGQGADSVKIGDLNGDGRVDLAVCHADEQQVSVLYQTASGGLAPPRRYPVASAGHDEIEIGDLTGDGLADLVVMRGQDGPANLLVLAQDPQTHLLREAVPYGWGDHRTPHGLALADLNGDGRIDVAVTWGGHQPDCGLGLFLQNAQGTLGSPTALGSTDVPEPVRAADMNGDGLADLVVVHGGWQTVSTYLQQPDGTFGPEALAPLPFASHYEPQGLALGDLNGDGKPDVAIADQNNGLVLLYNAGNADLTPPHTTILQGPPLYSRDSGATFRFIGLDDTTPQRELQYSWSLDSGAWSPFAAATAVTLTGLPEGWHRFSVAARDAAGNVDPTPAVATFAVDRTPPDEVSVRGFSAYTAATAVVIYATARDNLADTRDLTFAWRVDGSPWSEFSAASKLTLYDLFEGPHTVDVRAADPAGNISQTPGSGSFVVDRTPPTTRIIGITRDAASGTVTAIFAATDNLPLPNRLSFSWRVDDGEWSPFSPSRQAVLRDLSPGHHTLAVRSRDSAGNIDPTPATQEF